MISFKLSLDISIVKAWYNLPYYYIYRKIFWSSPTNTKKGTNYYFKHFSSIFLTFHHTAIKSRARISIFQEVLQHFSQHLKHNTCPINICWIKKNHTCNNSHCNTHFSSKNCLSNFFPKSNLKCVFAGDFGFSLLKQLTYISVDWHKIHCCKFFKYIYWEKLYDLSCELYFKCP